MTSAFVARDRELISTFKTMLKEREFHSQEELAYELSNRGFASVSQSKISRMLSRVGAIRTRNAQNKVIYQLPDELVIPKVRYSIDTMALYVKNNGYQIVLKTRAGGASVIARVIDSMEKTLEVLGTIAGDDTVLVIPADINNIGSIIDKIADLLGIEVLQ